MSISTSCGTTEHMREERLKTLARIKELEAAGQFDADVEPGFPYQLLDPRKLDLQRKKLSSKIKTMVAYHLGKKFFDNMLRTEQVILKEPRGLENLEGFHGGAVVTCNHINPFDNYGVLLGLKKHFKNGKDGGNQMLIKIVNESNYSFPGLLGFLMRNCGTLPVSKEEQPNLKLTTCTLQATQYYLKRGKKVLIYPEASMWWNYRKPRPMKKGAFYMAAKFNAPIIPCFYTLKDNEKLDADGFPVQEFTLNVLPVIYPDPKLSVKENTDAMMAENARLWQETYEKNYCKSE